MTATARSCVFCGNAPTTSEHVWSDWLRRQLAIDEAMEHTRLLERHGKLVESLVFDDKPYKQTVKAVCGECNGGWMSQLEQHARSVLTDMIAGRWRDLQCDVQCELAGWALLKALMFDQASPRDARIAMPGLYPLLRDTGAPPAEGLWIWLSTFSGESLGFSALVALSTATTGQAYTGKHNVFVRTFSFGPVLFQVLATSNPDLNSLHIDWDALGPPPPPVSRIWPPTPPFRWLPDPGLTDTGVVWFANHIVATFIQGSESFPP